MRKRNQQSSQHNISTIIDVGIIIIGVFGIVGGLVHSLFFPENAMQGVYVLMGIAFFLYIDLSKRQDNSVYYKKIYRNLLILSVLLYFNKVMTLGRVLEEVIVNNFFLEFIVVLEKSDLADQIFPSLFIIFLCFPLVLMIVKMFVYKKRVILKLCFLLIVFYFPIFIRHRVDSLSSYCFIFFMTYGYIFLYSLKEQNAINLKKFLLPVLAVLLFLSSLFLEPNPIFKQQTSTVLMNITNWITSDTVNELIHGNNIAGTSSKISGDLPTSDVLLNNSLALTIRAKEPFSSYIRGYSLAKYDNNQWKPVESDFIFGFESSKLITNDFKDFGLQFPETEVEIISEKETEYQFVPYFPAFSDRFFEDSYYEMKEGPIKIYQGDPFLGKIIQDDIIFSKTEYDKYVEKEYLDVPENLKEKLTQFIRKYQKIDLFSEEKNIPTGEKIEQIHEMICKSAKYDLKSGDLPLDKDFVEYFLFENKKGSCSHFASTMTLMLRCLNIPARYTRGYILSNTDFENGEAKVRSNRSHAWVEVYYRGHGWIPFEATPQSDDVYNPLETTANELDNLMNQNQQENPQNQIPDLPAIDDTPVNQNDIDTTLSKENQWKTWIIDYLPMLVGIAAIIFVLFVYRKVTLHYFKYKIRKFSSNQKAICYYRRMNKIQRYGVLIDSRMLEIANKAKFSQHIITEEELQSIADIYNQYINDIYHKLPSYKKFVFKYILGYI